MKVAEPLLEIKDVSVSFCMYEEGNFMGQSSLPVISHLSLTVHPGEVVAIVGSSGSGKSLLAHAILGLLPENAAIEGQIFYKQEVLTKEKQKALCGTKLALVPQSVSYLDPLMKVGAQVYGHRKPCQKERRVKIWQRLGLEETTQQLYPFQLSGGMARRVLVSTALLSDADLILADEPTPGMSLDQALEALTMFRDMANEQKGVILITHDLDLAVEFADRVAVFYAGTILETALASDFKQGVEALRHPYSRALWKALPQNGFQPIEGFQPYVKDLPKGCLFAPRCPQRTVQCEEHMPQLQHVRGGEVRCFYGA